MERRIFRLLAGLCFVGALYHATAAIAPELAVIAPSLGMGGARWRHVLFIGISLVLAWYLLRRPVWFLPFALALAVQQFHGHGSRLIAWWQADRRIDWTSIVVLVGFGIALPLLFRDAWLRYGSSSRSGTSAA